MTTFDGFKYNYEGNCEYILLKMDDLKITMQNVPCSNVGETSCSKKITLTYGPVTIVLSKDNVKVGNLTCTLPCDISGVKVSEHGGKYITVTIDDLSVVLTYSQGRFPFLFVNVCN